jgi:N-methylhydantoinase A
MLMADVVHDFARTFIVDLGSADTTEIEAAFREREALAGEALDGAGFSAAERDMARTADIRYQGQEHTVAIDLPAGVLDDSVVGGIREAFGSAHEAQYGHRTVDPVEIVTIRVRGIGLVPRPALPLLAAGDGRAPVPRGHRDVWRDGGVGRVSYAVVERDRLAPGQRLEGPAIIEERTGTTVIHTGDVLLVGDHGELDISIGSGAQG